MQMILERNTPECAGALGPAAGVSLAWLTKSHSLQGGKKRWEWKRTFLIQWDPFWGGYHSWCKCMVIFEGSPFLIVHGLGWKFNEPWVTKECFAAGMPEGSWATNCWPIAHAEATNWRGFRYRCGCKEHRIFNHIYIKHHITVSGDFPINQSSKMIIFNHFSKLHQST